MTRPRPPRGQTAPKPLTAQALMEDLNALYARIQLREQAEDLAALRALRRQKRRQKKGGDRFGRSR